MDIAHITRDRLTESIATKQRILNDDVLLSSISQAACLLVECLEHGNSVYFCGNGGSAADAQHLAAELSGKFYQDRKALSAEALHCNSSFLTAVANDYSFDKIYSRLLEGVGRKGDVLVGLSTSGNSANIVKAVEQAKTMNIATIALTGSGGGVLKAMVDVAICVPSNDTPRIQEAHITIGHIICEIIESSLFPQITNEK